MIMLFSLCVFVCSLTSLLFVSLLILIMFLSRYNNNNNYAVPANRRITMYQGLLVLDTMVLCECVELIQV